MNNRYNILLCDDHKIILDGISSMLHDTEYNIEYQAQDGLSALNEIKSNPGQYDIVISDISMPIMNGTELCKQIKQLFPRIKVLMLSMYSSSAVVKEALAAEADGFMLKNSGKEELLKALHRVVNDGTYYSDEIIPILYAQIDKEKQQRESLSMLTDRELEVLTLILKELTSEEIAEKLYISKRTVDNHRTHIMEKTQCKSTIGLVKFALRCGLEIGN